MSNETAKSNAATRRRAAAQAVEEKPTPEKELDEENESPDGLEALLEEGAGQPQEPEVRTRKQAAKEAAEAKADAKKKAVSKIEPRDDFVRDAKGQIRKDEDGDQMRYAPGPVKGVGYVNENGVLFPVGFKFKGGHVGTFGNVILNRCPECHSHNSIDDARRGICGNQKCGFNMVLELEEITL